MKIHSIIEIMENNPRVYHLLKFCPYEILKHWEIREYSVGQVICHQGESYNQFYLIAGGSVNIYYTAENGKRYSQEIQDTGEFFGEFEIFDQRPYVCSIEALTPLTLLLLEKSHFMAWIEIDKHFGRFITQHLCDDFYQFVATVSENNLYSLKTRLCKYLITVAKQQTREDPNPEIDFDKISLSERFGVAPRSVNRILQYLKEQQIIQINVKSMTITDLPKLIEESANSWFE